MPTIEICMKWSKSSLDLRKPDQNCISLFFLCRCSVGKSRSFATLPQATHWFLYIQTGPQHIVHPRKISECCSFHSSLASHKRCSSGALHNLGPASRQSLKVSSSTRLTFEEMRSNLALHPRSPVINDDTPWPTFLEKRDNGATTRNKK